MKDSERKPKLIEIKKYQNRRYYDTTNSQHLSLEKIHKLICQGFDIQVIDAKTGQDITTKILAQILLEYEPMKLDFFSPQLLTQVIRLNDMVLRDFYETYFNQALKVFVQSKDRFDNLLRKSQAVPFAQSAQNPGETHNPFAAWMSLYPFGSADYPATAGQDSGLSNDVEELRKQVAELKDLLKRESK